MRVRSGEASVYLNMEGNLAKIYVLDQTMDDEDDGMVVKTDRHDHYR